MNETKYVNIYHDSTRNNLWTGLVYETREEAVEGIDKHTSQLTFLNTVEIQISPKLIVEYL